MSAAGWPHDCTRCSPFVPFRLVFGVSALRMLAPSMVWLGHTLDNHVLLRSHFGSTAAVAADP
eukprot:6270528-Alexandrium_andersonii.AAC.1